MQVWEQLATLKGQFGPSSAGQAERLLRRLSRHSFLTPEEAIHTHETLLFLRAYPQSPEVARLCDRILETFDHRIATLEQAPFDEYDICGIAGTSLSSTFSYEFARSLAERHAERLSIDWESYANSERLGIVLAQLVPSAREDY